MSDDNVDVRRGMPRRSFLRWLGVGAGTTALSMHLPLDLPSEEATHLKRKFEYGFLPPIFDTRSQSRYLAFFTRPLYSFRQA